MLGPAVDPVHAAMDPSFCSVKLNMPQSLTLAVLSMQLAVPDALLIALPLSIIVPFMCNDAHITLLRFAVSVPASTSAAGVVSALVDGSARACFLRSRTASRSGIRGTTGTH